MLRPLAALLPLLAAAPALGQSVASAACGGQAAELSLEGRLTLDGEDLTLDAVPGATGAQWFALVCQARDGRTVFGLVGATAEGEVILLLDPATRELRPATPEEAQALGLT